MNVLLLILCSTAAFVIATPFYDENTAIYYDIRSHIPIRISSIKNSLFNAIFKRNQTASITDSSVYHRNGTSLRKIVGYRSQNGCSCKDYTCGCCAGINISQFNFKRDGCMNFQYDPEEFAITMNMLVDDNPVYTNKISAQNPPPLCIPVPIPYLPVGVDFCVKLFDINTADQKLHMCLDFETRIQSATILILHFDCMNMGNDGVSLVKPGGTAATGGGNPVSSVVASLGTATTEPPQIDSDVYDAVTEMKRNTTQN